MRPGKGYDNKKICLFLKCSYNTPLLDLFMFFHIYLQAVYDYLALFLPCTKDTLLKRAKNLFMQEQVCVYFVFLLHNTLRVFIVLYLRPVDFTIYFDFITGWQVKRTIAETQTRSVKCSTANKKYN